MRINTLIHSVLLFTLCALVMPLQAQNDWCNRAKKNMEQAWKEGNYKQVETFYNNNYLGEYKCPRDKNIELKIAERKKTKTSTTGTTSNNQKNEAEGVKPPNQPVQKGSTSSSPASKDQTITVNGVSFKMVYVEGGEFDNEYNPAHQVKLSSYSIGETEVTQALWKAIMGSEPTDFGGWTKEKGLGDNYPVYWVSLNDVHAFIRELNRKTGRTFRLPTKQEWKYAARGGNKSRGYKYSGSNTIGDVAWYDGNSGDKAHPVKTKKANELGLYDMSGNVWEYYEVYYDRMRTDGLCGGGWDDDVEECIVSAGFSSSPSLTHNAYNFGFRLVLVQ